MEEYYATFVKELDGLPVPYTLQQLKDSYEVYFPIMALIILAGIAPLLKLSNIPEEVRESLQTATMDKMVGLLEDFITTHESSIKKFPKYFEFDNE